MEEKRERYEKQRRNCEKIWKTWKKSILNSEMIWKIWKKVSRIEKRFGQYGRQAN